MPLTNDVHAKLKAAAPNSKRKKERQKPEPKTRLAAQFIRSTGIGIQLATQKKNAL